MEAFNCGASMDYDQEGEWTEILQKWDEHALSGAHDHSDDPSGTLQTPTRCTSMLNVHSSLAMESLSPNFLPLNPSFPNSSSMSLISPQSLNIHTPITNQLHSNQPVISLEAAIIDHLNSAAANLNTNIDADSLISTVKQQDESENHPKSSWFSTFLQSLQSHPSLATTGLSSSSSFYNNLLNIGGDDQRGLGASAPSIGGGSGDEQRGLGMSTAAAQSYSNQPGLDEMMEQMSNDFINYGAPGSLQEHLSNALSASNVMVHRTELMTGMEGTGASASISTVATGRNDWTGAAAAQSSMLMFTPTSSVSSDGGPDDDSSSHEDVKDSIDLTHPLDPFDDLMMQSAPPAGHPRNLNISPLPTSAETISSQVKLQAESPAAPSTTHDQDKKRGPKSARVTKKPKRERGAKLAIKIQSDVEVLDDGYKWRKYGQKAVKNSPFPRSYYKCTDKQCKVKKHVERQAHECDFVVVTYEGVHNHSRPDQLQVFNSQSDTRLQHDSFSTFTSTSSNQHLSPMEILGLRSNTLFQTESQPSHPLQQSIPSTHHTVEAIDQGVLQNLSHGEPRRSST